MKSGLLPAWYWTVGTRALMVREGGLSWGVHSFIEHTISEAAYALGFWVSALDR